MIIVNTQRSYPPIARRMLMPPPGSAKPVTVDALLLEELAHVTGGEWLSFTDAVLRANGDYLLGTCGGEVTVAYRITGYERTKDSKLRFEVEPALELAHVLGTPQPGGPWKQGEARGIRQMTTPALPEDAARLGDFGTWVRSVLDAAGTILHDEAPGGGTATAWLREQWEAARDVSGVRVSSRPDGTIVVDVPAGHDVLVRTVGSESVAG